MVACANDGLWVNLGDLIISPLDIVPSTYCWALVDSELGGYFLFFISESPCVFYTDDFSTVLDLP